MRWRLVIFLLWGVCLLCLLRVAMHQQERNRIGRQVAAPATLLRGSPLKTQPQGEPPPAGEVRLNNTRAALKELIRSSTAILLENALYDTSKPLELPIPPSLRNTSDPGAYLVQCKGELTDRFRAMLKDSGAIVIAYVPNNTYLVRAPSGVAQRLSVSLDTQAVIAYEPYFKLKADLLGQVLAAEADTASRDRTAIVEVNALAFVDARESAQTALAALGAEILGQGSTPFGPLLRVRLPLTQISAAARLPAVQELEQTHRPVPANDLSRTTLGIADSEAAPANHLGLSGEGILVDVNDTGIDAAQPDLSGRVLLGGTDAGADTNGHGTHIAGVIAGNGSQSLTVTNAPGSILPATSVQFRGKAPAARLFSVNLDALSRTAGWEESLQQLAALTNALISNNSWHYANDNGYDLGAASFDAAVRDALPGVTGAQPVLFVFAAGNEGHGADDGSGGRPDSIQSPATAKNVITVGAVEQPRWVTNQTWECDNDCTTNRPWLSLTDSSNQVASFSSRGNVGVGTEADYGRFKPDVVAPGTFVLSTRSGQWNAAAYYAQARALVDSPDTNYFEVLSNLNDSCGPFYRFESGSSIAAAQVSGTLALMQQFFEQRLGRTNSPALMKALLINGARSLGKPYDLDPRQLPNTQGWGLIHLPNSLPAALTNKASPDHSMFMFDQNPADALASGQSRTRFISIKPAARCFPLRLTLTWTDPPANPAVSLKLVNDLDLVVTNLDTGAVFFGNDIPPGEVFNPPWDRQSIPNRDFINNVENVYLAPELGSNYSVTISARRVAVNAVSAHPNDVVQDYALVVASGDGEIPDALAVTDAPTASVAVPPVVVLSNSFNFDALDAGSLTFPERLGANSPLVGDVPVPLAGGGGVLTIGDTNQWHFYVVTNDGGFTNAAFLTFLPTTLSLPAGPDLALSGKLPPQPDIDLYVSSDPGLTNLDPAVLASADYSVSRGGSEQVSYANATGSVYYAAVKCESQEAAQYGFMAVFSPTPFAESDAQGNQIVRGFPAPSPIPNGSPEQPGTAYLVALATDAIPLRRVIVTNTLTHPHLADLQGTLIHGSADVVLNRLSNSLGAVSQVFVYDDSNEGDFPWAQRPDGPGALSEFAGTQGAGQWLLTMASTNQAGTDENFGLFLEAQPDLSQGFAATILPGVCRQDFIYVPLAGTNLTLSVLCASGTGPLSLQLSPAGFPLSQAATPLLGPGESAQLTLDAASHPPLTPGLCVLRLCNLGPDAAVVNLFSTCGLDVNPPAPLTFTSPGTSAIPDDAVSSSSILVTNIGPILSVEAGVRIGHPRVSDLALTLISPSGTRVLLAENRGGLTTNGIGADLLATNSVTVQGGGAAATTNQFDTGQTSSVVSISYNMHTEPDTMHVYYNGHLIFDSGLVSGEGSTNIPYGPEPSTLLTIVMNEGGNPNPNTVWLYTAMVTAVQPLYLTFTENTNLTSTPIKFAPAPLTNLNYFNPGSMPSNGIFYLPEQSLEMLSGEPAAGPWTLEIADRRAGATNPPPTLLSWQLLLRLRNTVPVPIVVTPGQPGTNVLGPGQLQWFAVDTPPWISFATNNLLFASLPLNLWYNPAAVPTGTNSADLLLLGNASAGVAVLQTNGLPPLSPGARYFLAVQNTNSTTVSFVFQLDFDVTHVVTLSSGFPYAPANSSSGSSLDFYRYVVSTNAVRTQFEINGPSADLTLFARRGLPLPNPGLYDYVSANPGTNDELIVVYDFSQPVPLTPGEWFLAVGNTSGQPATYTILATDFPAYGTNIVLSGQVDNDTYCLSWGSLPGIHYVVEGKIDLGQSAWTVLSPTLTANDYTTSYCLPMPLAFNYFRVREGLLVIPPPPVISSISLSPRGVLLGWNPPVPGDLRFRVEWTDSLSSPDWHAFADVVGIINGTCSFLDDGSQSGGLGSSRFYRVVQLP